MKLLLDENAPRTIVEVMRNCGYDLLWIREHCRGMADEEIVRLSISENRVILTFDKDFGELIYRKPLASVSEANRLRMNTPGVILARIPNKQTAKERILEFLKKHGDKLRGYFTVLTENRIRRRRLPNS
jgi:uncharacterized protein with PIN domain